MRRKIDGLGRVTIPKEWRNELGIKDGDPVEMSRGKDGAVVIRPVQTQPLFTEAQILALVGYAADEAGVPEMLRTRLGILLVGEIRKAHPKE